MCSGVGLNGKLCWSSGHSMVMAFLIRWLKSLEGMSVVLSELKLRRLMGSVFIVFSKSFQATWSNVLIHDS